MHAKTGPWCLIFFFFFWAFKHLMRTSILACNLLHSERSWFHLHSLALCLVHVGTRPPFVEGINESRCKHTLGDFYIWQWLLCFVFIVTMVCLFVCFAMTLSRMLSNLTCKETKLTPWKRCLWLGNKDAQPRETEWCQIGRWECVEDKLCMLALLLWMVDDSVWMLRRCPHSPAFLSSSRRTFGRVSSSPWVASSLSIYRDT